MTEEGGRVQTGWGGSLQAKTAVYFQEGGGHDDPCCCRLCRLRLSEAGRAGEDCRDGWS